MNNSFANEFKRFLKDHTKKIILGSLLISFFFTAYREFIASPLPRNNETLEETEQNIAEPAIFQFYVEHEDGSVFTNTTLLEDYFLLPDTISIVERETGIQISDMLEEQWESGFEKNKDDRGILGVKRGTHSHVFSLVAKLGNREDNMAVAQSYYNMVVEDEIPFLTSKNVYIFVEPTIVEKQNGILSSDAEETSGTRRGIWSSIMASAIIGFSIGLIGLLITFILFSILGKKLNYSFDYNWDERDLFFLYDEKLKNADELEQFLLHPFSSKKLYLSEHSLSTNMMNLIEKQNRESTKTNEISSIIVENTLADTNVKYVFDEVIIFIQSGETTKKWYNKQRRMLENYNANLKIIQLNTSM